MTEMIHLGDGQSYNDSLLDISDTKIVYNTYHDKNASKSQANNEVIYDMYKKKLELLLNGDFDVQVGKMLHVKLPDRYHQTEYNKELGGDYIIEKVAYYFTNSDFKMKLLISKNASYESDVKTNGEIFSAKIDN